MFIIITEADKYRLKQGFGSQTVLLDRPLLLECNHPTHPEWMGHTGRFGKGSPSHCVNVLVVFLVTVTKHLRQTRREGRSEVL